MHCRIFISCATSEFKSLRQRLRSYLTAAECEVKSQEDFHQSNDDIVEKLDDYIRKCDAVIHVIGHKPGSVANEKPCREFLAKNEDFLAEKSELLTALGEFSDLTYTHWEVFLAIHHGRKIRAYHFPGAQQEHRARLKLGLHQRYSTEVADESDIFGALIGDLREIVPDLPAHRISNIPSSIGTLFKGRDTTLQELRNSLEKAVHHATAITSPKAIHGLGGVGKTRLAIEYGRRFAGEYNALLLVRASSPADFRRNLAELAGPLVLDLPEYTNPDETKRLAAALRWLEDHPGWFLIIDNVDTETAGLEVQAYLDRLTSGHVVITSRLSDWAGGVETLDLSVLDESDAIAFLMERTAARRPKAPTDTEDVRNLARLLDGLALALEQAGAYIAERRVTFRKYLDHWQTRRQKVLIWHNEAKMRYPASVAITWQTSFDEIDDNARRLLEVLAQLAPDPIPRGIIEEVDDTGDLEDAFVELERYSLVRILQEPPDTFSVHRLVQEIVREFSVASDSTPVQNAGVETESSDFRNSTPNWLQAAQLLQKWAPEGGQDISTWDAWTLLDPHLDQIFDKSAVNEIPGPDPAPIPFLLEGSASFQHFRNGDYSLAERYFERALTARERDLDTEHPDTLHSVNNLAVLLKYKGAYDEAEPLYRRALEARERILGAEHPDTLNSVNNLAFLLKSKESFDEAEPLYRRALEARKRVLGPDHPETLESTNNLAVLLKSIGAFYEAEQLYRLALKAQERVLGSDHPDTLTSVNNLAGLLETKGSFEEAEPLYRRALEASTRVLGGEHPDTLISLNNLADLLETQGQFAESEPLFRRAYEGFLNKLGPEHPTTHQVKCNWKRCLTKVEETSD